MDKVALNASVRISLGKRARDVRDAGKIPAVVYGHHHEAEYITVEYQEFRKAYRTAGKNTIVELSIEGKKVPVLVHDVQEHPWKNTYSHIDFHAISMKEKVHTSIPVHFVGESDAVKLMAGTLVHAKETIEIKALPANLPHFVEVDLSKLVDFHSTITVADIVVAKEVEVLDDPAAVVASVMAPRAVEVEAPVAEAAPVEGAAATPAEGEAKAE